MRLSFCIKELEGIYSIRNGSVGKVAKDLEGHNVSPKTESDLAEELPKKTDGHNVHLKTQEDLLAEFGMNKEELKIEGVCVLL